ncbi:MAG: TRAP transporter large permease subunit [Sulfolobales archaeon]
MFRVLPVPLLMFIALFILLLFNLPVAFALFLVSLSFGLHMWGWRSLDIIFNGIWAAMNNWPLVALPLYVFMSALMERCGLAEDMFKAIYRLLGGVRGSLAVIAIVLGYLIGAMSGVVAAGVVCLALLLYPLMLKYGYDKRLAVGVILAAGSLPQLVPPSTNMIIYGVATGTSIAALFAGGIGIGAIMASVFAIYVLVWSYLHPDKAPVLPPELRGTLKERITAMRYALGPLAIIIGTLGSIFAGLATPTEAAGIGALLTVIYAVMLKRLNRRILIDALSTTVRVVAMVCWIVAGSQGFASIFTALGGRRMVTEFMISLPQAEVSALALSIAFVVFLGMFLDTAPIALVVGPILAPVIRSLGYDITWWGLVFCTTLLTAYLTPPVGMGIFYFKGIYQDIPLTDIYKAVIPFILLMLVTVAIIVVFPDAAMSIVRLLLGR